MSDIRRSNKVSEGINDTVRGTGRRRTRRKPPTEVKSVIVDAENKENIKVPLNATDADADAGSSFLKESCCSREKIQNEFDFLAAAQDNGSSVDILNDMTNKKKDKQKTKEQKSNKSQIKEPNHETENRQQNSRLVGRKKSTKGKGGEIKKKSLCGALSAKESPVSSSTVLFRTSLLQDYEVASSSIIQESNFFVADSDMLMEAVAGASELFPLPPSSGVLLLEESSIQIVEMARKCIRWANESSHRTIHDFNVNGSTSSIHQVRDDIEDVNILHSISQELTVLRISIHCLRAIAHNMLLCIGDEMREDKKIALIIKLLFHEISVAKDIHACIFKQMKHMENQYHVREIFVDASLLCFHGYHLLGLFLSRILLGSNKSNILLHDLSSQLDCCTTDMYDPAFPIPFAVESSSAFGGPLVSGKELSTKQIFKIATQSSLSLASVMNYIGRMLFLPLVEQDKVDGGMTFENFKVLKDAAMRSCFVGGHRQGENNDDVDKEEAEQKNVIHRDWRLEFIDCYRNFMSKIMAPWMVLTILQDIDAKATSIQDSVSTTSKVSQMLLNIASSLEKSCSDNDERYVTTGELQRQSLMLQHDSIMLLLMHWKSSHGRWISVHGEYQSNVTFQRIVLDSFGKCCAAAIRAASTFAASHGANTLALSHFHGEVGGLLDQISHQNDLLEPQYLEYCAHRSFHIAHGHIDSLDWTAKYCCESQKCPMSLCTCFPFAHHSHGCMNGDPKLSIMALFHVCLAAMKSLQIFQRREVDAVIESFHLKVINSNDSKLLMLSHKILSKLKLQSVSSDEVLKAPNTNENCLLIYVLSQVLSKCYGPLNLFIMELGKADKNRYLAVALECYLKSAVLMDGIAIQTDFPFIVYDLSSDRCYAEADKLVESCRKISADCDINSCHNIISSVAKSISNIGKRRISVGQPIHSIFPLLASAEIFNYLGDKELAHRFIFISTTLQSLNFSGEALVALCFSISVQVENEPPNSPNWGSILENIVLFCHDYVKGNIPFDSFLTNDTLPELLSKALARSGRLFLSMIGYENERHHYALKISSSSSFIKKFIGASSFDYMDLLRYFVHSVWAKEYSSYSCNYMKYHMIVAIEFIQAFGNCAIQRIRHDPKSIQIQNIFDCLLSFSDGVKGLVEVVQGVQSSLKVSLTIAIAAVARRLNVNSNEIDEARRVDRCLMIIGNDVDGYLQHKWPDSTTAQFLVYKASITLLQASMQHQGSKGATISAKSSSREIIKLYTSAFSLQSNSASNGEGSDSLRKYQNAILVTLLNIFQTWNHDGSSAEAAECVGLLKILERSDIEQTLKKLIRPILANGEMHNFSPETSTSHPECCFDIMRRNIEMILQRMKDVTDLGTLDNMIREGEEKSDFVLELFAASSNILSFMISCDVRTLQEAGSALSNTLSNLQEICLAYTNTSGSNEDVSLSVTWWLSSCLFALFFGNIRVGNFNEAHICLRLCCDITKHTHENFKGRRHQLHIMDAQSASFFTSYLCSNSFSGLLYTRLGQTLQHMALLYLYSGDARKSRTYAITSAKYYSLISQLSSSSDCYLVDKFLWQIHENCRNIRSLEIRTTATKVFSLTSPFSEFDKGAIVLLEKIRREEHLSYQCPFLNDQSIVISEADIDWSRQQLNFLIQCKFKKIIPLASFLQYFLIIILVCNRSKLLKTFSAEVLNHVWQHYTVISTHVTRNSINLDVPLSLNHPHSIEFIKSSLRMCTHSYSNTISKAALIFAKDLIDRHNDSGNPCAMEILGLISQNSYASNTDRAEALYLIAINSLQAGRQSGELQTLWYGYSSKRANGFHNTVKTEILECSDLGKARDYFLRAWELVGPASTYLSRSILRSLALTLGPEMKCTGDTLLAGELVHSSIGSTSRQTVVRRLQHNSCTDIRDIFNAFDLPHSNPSRLSSLKKMYKSCQKIIPSTWQFLACATCPTGELLFSVFRDFESVPGRSNFSYQTYCFFPHHLDHNIECIENLLERFDCVMEQSKQQLKEGKIGEDKDMKRKWWEERYRLDEELSQLLHDFEDVYFRPILREELLRFSSQEDEEETLRSGDLSARFEAACAIDSEIRASSSERSSLECLKDLTVVQLKEELRNLGFAQHELRSLRKSQLLDLLHETLQAKIMPSKEKPTDSHLPSEDCTFLILDENLHRLPLEGMVSLRQKVVCRLPSLPFAIASMHIRTLGRNDISPYVIDPSVVKYVIDPESNLTSTRERISSVLSSAAERNGWDWEGCIGKTPSKEFMHDILQQQQGLYLYFGHGAGESFFSRGDIDDFASKHSNSWRCSAVVLMGCSSGELKTVNGQYGAMSGNPIHFEPEGVALSYLCAGAPCVVANLWDVTDYDIDRFSISFLKGLFRGSRMTLGQSVTSSRDACKLKYLVGTAPIIYGIPVTIRDTT